MDMAIRSQNHENGDFGCFVKVGLNNNWFPVKKNNYAELLGYSKLKFRVKMVPQTPTDPKSDCFIEPQLSPYRIP